LHYATLSEMVNCHREGIW